MWTFFNNLLNTGGFVAVVYAVTVMGLVAVVRALWKKIGEKESLRAELEGSLRMTAVAKEAAVSAVRTAETEKRARMRAAFDAQLVKISEDRRKETADFAEKLEQLQERRVQDAHTTVREAVEHIAETRSAVEKITHAMQTLERVLRA